ncbi:DUF6783 domain-containing protein [uncultured Clostridium sp.]
MWGVQVAGMNFQTRSSTVKSALRTFHRRLFS